MKKLIALTAAVAFTAAPAFAGKITIAFAPDGAAPFSITLDDATKTVAGPEGSAPYTFDNTTNTLCVTIEPEVCATFAGEAKPPVLGDTSTYTSNNGSAGTATIVSIE